MTNIEELKEYIEKHLRECYDFHKSQGERRTVPKLYSKGYDTALWHILYKIDKDRYLKLLDELKEAKR